jgi:anti-sigma B factor antagonist
MKITIQDIHGVKNLSLVGRFDASSAASFRDTIKTLLQGGAGRYVVDFQQVNYIDSGGLGSLVASLRQIRQVEGDIKVSGLTERVRSVFELTRLHRIFEIFEDSSQATRSYHGH